MREVDPVCLAKSVLWEEAKGKLRAIIAAEGATHGKTGEDGRFSFEKISDAIEAFITEFEALSYHE